MFQSFRAKFALALAIPMILLIISNSLGLNALVKVGDAQQRLSKAETIRVTAEDVKYQVYLTRFNIRQYVLKVKKADYNAFVKSTAALDADISTLGSLTAGDAELSNLIGGLKPNISLFNSRNYLQMNAITKDRTDMLGTFEGVKGTGSLGGDVLKSLADNNVTVPLIIVDLTKLDALTTKRVNDAQAAVDSIYKNGLMIAITAVIVAVVIGIIIVLVMGAAVTRPLSKAVSVADAIANNDLSSTFDVASNDEIGHVLRSMETMQGNLRARVDADKAITADMDRVVGSVLEGDLTSRIDSAGKDGATRTLAEGINKLSDRLLEIVTQMKETSSTVNVAAQQIAAGNSDLARRTEEQASSLEETASSMEELTSTVRQNAENAKHANQLGMGARDIAQKGGVVMSDVVQTMGEINGSSTKIVEIISVIDGIAFQTNILALNAAVEAARAGEQGRGFAVVASEVRSLAQRSSAAAKEIKTLIGDTVNKVVSGSGLVEQAGKTMEQVVDAVKKVTDIMGDISAASDEQSAGIEQVNKAVIQMDEVTQQNAALVEEAAAAAASLEDQSASLVRMMSAFKLATDDRISLNASPMQVSAVHPKQNGGGRPPVTTTIDRALPSGSRRRTDGDHEDGDWETF